MRIRSRTAEVAAALFLFGSALVFAEPHWTRLGPEGGLPSALAAAPSRPGLVYVGLYTGGVFRSADRGQTWRFAGHGEVFLSTNGGRTWRRAGPGSPSRPAALLASPAGLFVGDTPRGIAVSTDRGASWRTGRGSMSG